MTTKNLDPATVTIRVIGWMVRCGLLAVVAIVLAGFSSNAQAADEVNTSNGLTIGGVPLAIHGYDPVAYFTEGRALVGKAVFTATHERAAYRFVTHSNQQRFEANPQRYAPRYGGFCAFGVSVGAKFDGDPTLFRIVDNKLYFNLNPDIQDKWIKDIPGNIRKANRNWTQIRHKVVSELT